MIQPTTRTEVNGRRAPIFSIEGEDHRSPRDAFLALVDAVRKKPERITELFGAVARGLIINGCVHDVGDFLPPLLRGNLEVFASSDSGGWRFANEAIHKSLSFALAVATNPDLHWMFKLETHDGWSPAQSAMFWIPVQNLFRLNKELKRRCANILNACDNLGRTPLTIVNSPRSVTGRSPNYWDFRVLQH
jgi:hypothetical protein